MAVDTPGAPGAGRRRFLKWASILSAALSSAVVGIPSLRALFSPAARRRAPERWVDLGPTTRFLPGPPIKVDFSEQTHESWIEAQATRSVWVYTVDGKTFTVYGGRCTHLGCSFVFAAQPEPAVHSEANVFRCPCHNGVFALADGTVLHGPPPRALDRLDVKIDNGMLHAKYQDFRVGVSERVPL